MLELKIFLNQSTKRNRKTPIYKQVYEAIRTAILDGQLKAGTKLPSTRFISKDLKISRNTVMNAFDQLIAEGYLITRSGSGTFVANQLPDDLLEARKFFHRAKSKSESLRITSKRSELVLQSPDAFGSDSVKARAFKTGFSAIDEFPLELWIRNFSKCMRKMPRVNLDYGNTKGYMPLRRAIAAYLGSLRGVRCAAEQVLIVSGSQQGMDLAMRILLDEGDEALIEDPGYLGARGAFLGTGINPVPIPIDSEGIDINEFDKRSKNARAVYVTPSHQFPTGVVMSLSRRLEILEWADRNSAWVIEDDYDSEFRYDGRPLAALQGLDNNNRVIYIGTFSKILFPSIRLGYLIVPQDLIEKFESALALTTAHSSQFEQIALAEFINQGHFSSHIRRMRGIYAKRQKCLIDAINTELNEFLEVKKDNAGMHIVAWLKKGWNDRKVAEFVLENGIYVAPISHYCISEKIRDSLLLGYTGISQTEIERNIVRLKTILQNYPENN